MHLPSFILFRAFSALHHLQLSNGCFVQVTTDYSNDFDKLRQDPSFSGNKIGLLVDCLESGIDIFAPPANLENAD